MLPILNVKLSVIQRKLSPCNKNLFVAIREELSKSEIIDFNMKSRIASLQSRFKVKASFLAGYQLRQLQSVLILILIKVYQALEIEILDTIIEAR